MDKTKDRGGDDGDHGYYDDLDATVHGVRIQEMKKWTTCTKV